MPRRCRWPSLPSPACRVVNYFGVKPGSRVLNVLVVLKVGALAVLIIAGALAPSSAGWWSAARASAAGASTLVAFGAALVPDPLRLRRLAERELHRRRDRQPAPESSAEPAGRARSRSSLIYVTVNIVYLRALGLEGLAATTTPASKAAAFMFGALGDRFVTAAIAVSTFGFLDLAILAPTRVYYAMAADRVFLPALSRLHPKYQTPWIAILIQSTWSCVLALTGRVRTAAQLRRVRRLDLLRPDRRDGDRVSPDPSAVAAAAGDVPGAGISGRPDRIRRCCCRRRPERRLGRPRRVRGAARCC